jgi:membrane fusion protein (multidrug efflux system)
MWLFICAACERAPESPSNQRAPAAVNTPSVEVVQVVGDKLDTAVRLPGELVPYEVVALYPRVSGFVEWLTVDRGSYVQRGQLLVRLTAPELASQRAEAESKRSAAQSTFGRLRSAAETPGVIAKNELELSQAAVEAEEARVRSLKALEGYLAVRAPFAGVITERNVHPGALVGPPMGANSLPMLRIESVGHLRLTVPVPEADVGAIAEGSPATFIVRAWPGRRFSGIIRRIAHSLDTRTRTMPVELDVDNRDGKLAPGMFVEVVWPIRRDTPSLFVPTSAVVDTTEKTYVDRVRGGVLEKVPIQRGMVLPDRVEVFGSLRVGDTVLKRGSEELKEGTQVQPRFAAPDGGAR